MSSIGLGAIPAAHAQVPETSIEVTRYAGADRYETSLVVADQLLTDAGGSLDWAVMVSGRSWPDAVMASSLAGALNAPLLLTPPAELLDSTAKFLDRAGISRLLVVGSPDSPGVGPSVVSELSSTGYAVERVTGSSRSATSIAAARRLGTIRQARSDSSAAVGSMPGLGATAIVASSDVFADALVAGSVSAHGEHPVLLNPPGRLDSGIAAYLTEAGVEHVVLMGGTAALKPAVQRELADLGLEVTRLAGATRFETAVLMADLVSDRYTDTTGRPCFSRRQFGLARARVPFDAFSAAPLLARRCAPLLLTDPTKFDPATGAHLAVAGEAAGASDRSTLRLNLFGGTLAISDEVVDAYRHGRAEQTTVDPGPSSAADACGGTGTERVRMSIRGEMRRMAWTSDCAKVLFISEFGALSVADGDGANPLRLLPISRNVEWASWSPDHRQIAFATNKRTRTGLVRHIHIVDADGSSELQLTDGAVNDNMPSWSPDGRRLVFQRRDGAAKDWSETARMQDTHIVIIDADGGNETPLLQGGATERFPSFSPDGSRIAYTANDAVYVINADGSERRYIAAADESEGVSWSPDGTRLAFGRSFVPGLRDAFVVAGFDEPGEQYLAIPEDLQIAYTNRPASAPQWSSTGQRIFMFVPVPESGDFGPRDVNLRSVHQVPPTLLKGSGICMPDGPTSGITAGFPLPDWAVPAAGTLRVALLFVDFSDYAATYDTAEEMSSALFVKRHLEDMSGRRLEIELVPHHGWLRAQQPYSHYLREIGSSSGSSGRFFEEISTHAVQLADPSFDFADIDIVITVMPSSYFGGGGNEGDTIRADGNVMRTIRMNHQPGTGGYVTDTGGNITPLTNAWGRVASHELLHSLGLDHYYWGHLVGLVSWPHGHRLAPPELPDGHRWSTVEFGPLGLNARIPVPDGGLTDLRLEMLAWSRWQLGWLGRGQVKCVTEPTAQVVLSPVADSGGGVAMAAIELSRSAVIAIESRRLLGYDAPASHRYEQVADGNLDDVYLREGVLVYTVNPFDFSHPLRLAQDLDFGYLERSPLLAPGESVSIAGYTISVTGDTGTEHHVAIRKNR